MLMRNDGTFTDDQPLNVNAEAPQEKDVNGKRAPSVEDESVPSKRLKLNEQHGQNSEASSSCTAPPLHDALQDDTRFLLKNVFLTDAWRDKLCRCAEVRVYERVCQTIMLTQGRSVYRSMRQNRICWKKNRCTSLRQIQTRGSHCTTLGYLR